MKLMLVVGFALCAPAIVLWAVVISAALEKKFQNEDMIKRRRNHGEHQVK